MDRPLSAIGITDANGTTHFYRLAAGAASAPPPAAEAQAAQSPTEPAEAVHSETEQ
jgi:hypothetical protein